MKVSDYKTGMILKENNDYFLVLGMYAYEIEETKREIATYGINVINKDIDWLLYSETLCLLELEGKRVDFTKEVNGYLVFPRKYADLTNVEVVKTVKFPEQWILKNKLLCPSLRGVVTVEEGLKELKTALNSNKYKKAVNNIKRRSTFQKIRNVKSNQIVAIKLTYEYRIFLVEDTRVIEFVKPSRTRITELDLSNMIRVEKQHLLNGNEYYLLGGIKLNEIK